MTTYKAAIVKERGADFEIVERPIPEPKKGEVLIKVEACGVCHGDVHAKEGPMVQQWPRVVGHEVIGRIAKLGIDVDPDYFKIGKKVGVGWNGGHCFQCTNCRKGDFQMCHKSQTCGISYDGGYAQYMIAPHCAIAFVPDEMNSLEAAPLMCAGLTLYNAMRHSGAVAGNVVVIQGLGGLGSLGVQYSVKMGFKTVVYSTSEDKKDFALKELGAHYFCTDKDISQILSKLGGANRVFWTAPNTKNISKMVYNLAPNGRIVVLGVDQGTEVNPLSLISNRAGIQGHPSGTAADAEECIDFSQLVKVKPIIEVYPLTKVKEAYQRMLTGQARYRCVLDVWAE